MGGHGGGGGSEVRSTHHVSPAPLPLAPGPPGRLSFDRRPGRDKIVRAMRAFFCRAVRGKEDPRPARAATNFDFGQEARGRPIPGRPGSEDGGADDEPGRGWKARRRPDAPSRGERRRAARPSDSVYGNALSGTRDNAPVVPLVVRTGVTPGDRPAVITAAVSAGTPRTTPPSRPS